jgi:hypothetical protein
MAVTINNIRGVSAYTGDLSGSFMSPTVVGIAGVPVSGTLSNGVTLIYNSASNKFEYGNTQVDLSGYATLNALTGGLAAKADSSALADYLTTASAASTYATTASLASYLTTASAAVTYAITGSNTFVGNQIVTGSNTAFFIRSTGSIATSANHAFKVMQSGSVYGGFSMGMVSNSSFPRLAGLNSAGNTGASFVIQPDGGDVLMLHGNSKFIMASTFPSPFFTTHRLQVYSTNAASGAILVPTGTVDLRNGSLTVTGSIFSTAAVSASALTASNALISNNLSVAGNLTVNGTMTSVNSTNLEITDKYILIASGAADAAALDGAGLQFGTVPSEDARIIYDAVNDEMEIYPAARSAEFRGAFVGDGSSITGIPYDLAGDVTGSIESGFVLMNYVAPRNFTMLAYTEYTGSGGVSGYVLKNGVSASFPSSISTGDLITVTATTSGDKAYFTIKGSL